MHLLPIPQKRPAITLPRSSGESMIELLSLLWDDFFRGLSHKRFDRRCGGGGVHGGELGVEEEAAEHEGTLLSIAVLSSTFSAMLAGEPRHDRRQEARP